MAEYTSTVNITKQPAKERRRSEVNNKNVNATNSQAGSTNSNLAMAVRQQLAKNYSKK